MKKLSLLFALLNLLIFMGNNKAQAQDGNWYSSISLYGGPYNLLYNGDFDLGIKGWDYIPGTPVPTMIGPVFSWESDIERAVKIPAGAYMYQEIYSPVEEGDTLQVSVRASAVNGVPNSKYLNLIVKGYNYNGRAEVWTQGVELSTRTDGGYMNFQYDYIIPKRICRLTIGVQFTGFLSDVQSYGRVKEFYTGVLKANRPAVGGGGGGTSSQWTSNTATRISYGSQVAIGGDKFFNDNDYKLSVNGKMVAEELLIELNNTWPDYVFDPTYQLPSLTETEQFIRKHRHLPGIPSEKQIKEKGGVEIGELNRRLLEKVEQLTLYVIDLEKKYKALTAKQLKDSSR